MQKSIYDDETFFDAYSQMQRSVEGLAGAGEWEALKAILPDFQGKTVLDIGCGYGWHCQYAAEQGATSVIGIDPSEKMLEVAKAKNQYPDVVQYELGDAESLQFADEQFDVILSSLALHYVADYEQLIQKLRRMLKPQGKLIFTVEHPIFTAEGSEDWVKDTDGNIDHFPVDHYFEEGERATHFLGSDVKKYHRTLTTYIETLLKNGFILEHVIEPTPPERMLDQPGMRDELRRPMMLIIEAQKGDA
ncbi:class I SAM-dependent methyltransferase [Weissella viridescens]|uniref:Class I SAM-dependent methyltransferase n=1 Tax=Weissella viridescens TaxID=1629 RepID=A0A3P2RJI8_WEIVI|nr:class I SAM-dependent methyltransferase [Weissella viridescens]RRG17882.1 class I SAM-dependent methyltransferase [Weissella viridescens]